MNQLLKIIHYLRIIDYSKKLNEKLKFFENKRIREKTNELKIHRMEKIPAGFPERLNG